MTNRKIVYFTRYTRLGPSSRFRSYQFEPKLKERGVKVVMCPLFNDRYIQDLFSREPKKNMPNAALCYLGRLVQLLKYIRPSNFIIVEKEFLPYFPAFVEWWMNRLGIGYAVDIDDAVFTYYDNMSNPFMKLFLSKKIDKVFKNSRYVLAGNDYLASRAREAGARDIVLYPTIIDLKEYDQRVENYKYKREGNDKVVVGWVGSPSTVKYFQRIVDDLDELWLVTPFELRFIGSNTEFPFKNFKPKYLEFSEEQEVELISEFDIGIMPLKDTDFERGKCGLKLIQYFGCKLPVVASPVGVNSSIVEHGKNGFLATDSSAWKDNLSKLIKDENLRTTMGNAGHNKVIEKFDIYVNLKIIMKLIEKA